MCSRSGCFIGLASVCTWIAFLAAGVALFAPFWITFQSVVDSEELTLSKGIVLQCTEPFSDSSERSCDATLDNEWEGRWEGDFGEHLLIVQILWIIGTGVTLMASTFSIMLCCERCKTKCCSLFNTSVIFIGAGCLAAACILFYVNNEENVTFDRSTKPFFDWGFYCAIGGAGFAIIAVVFTILTICCLRKEV